MWSFLIIKDGKKLTTSTEENGEAVASYGVLDEFRTRAHIREAEIFTG